MEQGDIKSIPTLLIEQEMKNEMPDILDAAFIDLEEDILSGSNMETKNENLKFSAAGEILKYM